VLFAADGRVRPFNRYLAWELERHPLTALPVSGVQIERVAAAAAGDADAAVGLFAVVEATADAIGLRKVLDAWSDEQLTLARSA
jgi:hypothetical protein